MTDAGSLATLGFGALGLWTLIELVRRWPSLMDDDFTDADRELAVRCAFLVLVPPAVLLHELGHAVATWMLGGRVVDFEWNLYWGSVTAVGIEEPFHGWWVAAAGPLVSVAAGAVLVAVGLVAGTARPLRFIALQGGLLVIAHALVGYPLLALTGFGDWRAIYAFGPVATASTAAAAVHTVVLGGLWWWWGHGLRSLLAALGTTSGDQAGAVHPAARAFGPTADTYDRARPDYPSEALDLIVQLVPQGPGPVLDVGAGTGKMTRQLVDRGLRTVAVEPLDGMLRRLRDTMPGVQAVAAAAERLPVRDGHAASVVCAQSFHWFDEALAPIELHRVLAPDGVLVLVWNRRVPEPGWVAQLWSMVGEHRGDTPSYGTGRWRTALEGSRRFGPLHERTFPHAQTGSPDELTARVASISFVAGLPGRRRDELLGRVRELLIAQRTDTLVLPYETLVVWTRPLSTPRTRP